MARRELRAIISADARQFNRVLGRVKSTAVQTARVMGAIGVAVAGFSVKRAMDFEKQMAEINTIARLGKEDFAQLKKEVVGLSEAFGESKETLTKGLYDALSAGIPSSNGIEFLTKATKLAIGGVGTTAEAVDLLTTVLDAFGIGGANALANVDKVADGLFTTVEVGKTRIPELAQAIGQVASIAADAGVSLDQMFAAMSVLTKKTGDTARSATQLKGVINSFIGPSETLSAATEKLGFETAAAALKELGLDEALRRVTKGGTLTSDVMKALFPNIRGLGAATAISAKNGELMAVSLERQADKAGAADAAYKIMAETTDRQMGKLVQKLDSIAIQIGEALIDPLTEVAKELSAFLEDEENLQSLADSFRIVGVAILSVVKAMKELFDLGGRINDAVITPATEGLDRLAKKLGIVTENASKLAQTEKELSPEEVETGVLKPGAAINAPEVLNTVLTKVRDALFIPLKFAAELPTMLDVLREIRDRFPGKAPGNPSGR